MNNKTAHVLPVLLGGDLNAYGVAYSFYSLLGCTSHVFSADRLGITDNSSFIELHVHEKLREPSYTVDLLLKFASDHRNERLLLVPCADWYMELTENARDALMGHFYFNIPDYNVWRHISDKTSLFSLFDKFDIQYPKTVTLSAEDSVYEKSKGLLGPYVLKPADSSLYWRHKFQDMKKVYFLNNLGECEKISRKIFNSGYSGSLLLEEFITSENKKAPSSVLTTYSNSTGQVIMAARGDVILEENFPTAIGNYAAIITRELDDFSYELINMLNSVKYKGFANFDILSSEEGKYCLEVNTRQGRSSDYLRAAGISIAEYLISDMNGYSQPQKFKYKEALWLSVPYDVLQRYPTRPELLELAVRLYRAGKVSSVYDIEERNPLRCMYNLVHKVTQRSKFRKYRKVYP